MITPTNYTQTRYRGALRCGVASWPTHVSGIPRDLETRAKCSRVVFGPVFGDRRECDLFVDLGPGESVNVDVHQLDASPFQFPELGDYGRFGRPVLQLVSNGVVVHEIPVDPVEAETEVAGAKLRIHCAVRLDRLPFVDVWVDFVPGQPWADWELLITAANPAYPGPTWAPPTEIRLGWSVDNALVVRAGVRIPTLLRAGESIAHGQARAFFGVVAWQPLDEVDRGSAYVASMPGVVAFDTAMPTPSGLPMPELGRKHPGGIGWTGRHLAVAMANLDGYQVGEVGWSAASGNTGGIEDQGYGKGGEAVREPGAVLVSKAVAFGWARKPCHWVDEGGRLHQQSDHPQLVFWSGVPHWSPQVSPDRLGLARIPTTLETSGWSGPDREHMFANRFFEGLQATASPLLQKLAEHQVQQLLFGETTAPNLSTSGAGASRGIGWTCLFALQLLRLVRSGRLRGQLLDRMVDRLRLVILPTLEPLVRTDGGVSVMQQFPTTDQRGGVSQAFPAWWPAWQQSVGAWGLYMFATCRELQSRDPMLAARARAAAVAFARAVTQHATTPDGAGGRKTWDNVAVRADGMPLQGEEWTEGHGAHHTGWFRHAWTPFAFWVMACEGDPDARAHYLQLRAEKLEGPDDLAWLPPLPAGV
jgi:hypothetical protein